MLIYELTTEDMRWPLLENIRGKKPFSTRVVKTIVTGVCDSLYFSIKQEVVCFQPGH